ncbi:MAG: diheme cytochrome c [Methylocystaceae bacterium]|nr:diheme cytochrome c [Methylocystaceae bacterium]
MLNKKTLFAAALVIVAGSSVAHADERYRPISDEVVKKECGACHMAFQPQMLPKRSWIKIMDTLDDHFGEDASLDKETNDDIKNYLVENASDSGWWSGKFLRGVADDWTPLRITEIPYWVREHNKEVPNWAWSDPKVKSKANCVACHPRAAMGNYDDD